MGKPTPDELNKINGELQDLAVKHGASFLNLFELFADENQFLKEELTIDGVHFPKPLTIFGLKR